MIFICKKYKCFIIDSLAQLMSVAKQKHWGGDNIVDNQSFEILANYYVKNLLKWHKNFKMPIEISILLCYNILTI